MKFEEELLDSLRPGMTDLTTGSVAPGEMWDVAAAAVGTEESVLHASGAMQEPGEATVWSVFLLTETRLIRCVGQAPFVGWVNGSARSTDIFDVRADVIPLSSLRSYTVTDSKRLETGDGWAGTACYIFYFEGADVLTIDAAAVRHSQLRTRLEDAIQFLIDALSR
jgi:hypothetical protein